MDLKVDGDWKYYPLFIDFVYIDFIFWIGKGEQAYTTWISFRYYHPSISFFGQISSCPPCSHAEQYMIKVSHYHGPGSSLFLTILSNQFRLLNTLALHDRFPKIDEIYASLEYIYIYIYIYLPLRQSNRWGESLSGKSKVKRGCHLQSLEQQKSEAAYNLRTL